MKWGNKQDGVQVQRLVKALAFLLQAKSHYDNEINMVTHQGFYTSGVCPRSKNIMILNRLIELFIIIVP